MDHRTFAERKRAAPDEFLSRYGTMPDKIECYWFALTGRRPTLVEYLRINEVGLLGTMNHQAYDDRDSDDIDIDDSGVWENTVQDTGSA